MNKTTAYTQQEHHGILRQFLVELDDVEVQVEMHFSAINRTIDDVEACKVFSAVCAEMLKAKVQPMVIHRAAAPCCS